MSVLADHVVHGLQMVNTIAAAASNLHYCILGIFVWLLSQISAFLPSKYTISCFISDFILIFYVYFVGTALQEVKYRHPLTNEELPFLSGDHVTPNKGTGLVHTAPAHGHEDFQLAKNIGIKIVNLICKSDHTCAER